MKPVQQQLTGWITEVIKGTEIKVGDPESPVLNHINNEEDRKVVTGEKTLNISDKVSFKRKIFQTIESTPYVKLQDGLYTLTAKIKNSKGFTRLEMYAECNGKISSYNIEKENTFWKTISISNLRVRAGKVEIGFLAEGTANAFCYVDDVSLVKK